MKVLKVIQDQGIIQLKRLYRHHIIKVMLGMGVLPGCSVQPMRTLPLSFRQLRTLKCASHLILITFLNREIGFSNDVNQDLAVDELPLNISIEGVHISTKMLVRENNLFVERNDFFANYRNYTENERGNGATFTCADFSIAIIWWNNSVFVFVYHSRNTDGYHDSNGKAILLELCLVSSLNSYIKSFYENSNSISLETQYDLQCISVEIVEKNKTETLTKIRLKRKYLYHKPYYKKKQETES